MLGAHGGQDDNSRSASHHAGVRDAQRTVDFYTGVLGLRLVKQTVNFDDPAAITCTSATGRPGTAITFFEWPNAPRGSYGIGGTHHFALHVADQPGLLQWKRRLTDAGSPWPARSTGTTSNRSTSTTPTARSSRSRPSGRAGRWTRPRPSWGSLPQPPPAEMMVRNRDEAAHRSAHLARAGARDHARHGA